MNDWVWTRYLLAPDYDARERLGYTAAELLWKAESGLYVLGLAVSRWASKMQNWASR